MDKKLWTCERTEHEMGDNRDKKHKFCNDGYININLRQNSMKNLSHSK